MAFAAGSIEGSSINAILERMGHHAFVNAWMSGIQGQNMFSGMLTGAASSLGGAGLSSLNIENVGLLTAGNAVIGGTVSVIGGGKFANGAVTGAFTMLFNDLAHDIMQKRENLAKSADNSRKNQDRYLHCNEFAQDKLEENGMNPTDKALSAAEWANEGTIKSGWRPLEAGETAARGDIAAAKYHFPNGATGHMGIMLNSKVLGYAGGQFPYVVASELKWIDFNGNKPNWKFYRYIGK